MSTTLLEPTSSLFLTDGGLETTLLFHEGLDLEDFAAFPLLDDPAGREVLTRYYDAYLDVAEARGLGMVLDTPTWRASADWGARLGWSREDLVDLNTGAVGFVRDLAGRRDLPQVVLNGVIGPRGDGYVVGAAMSAGEAAAYHALQAEAFARGGAGMISAVTMNYVDEALGVVRAAQDAGLPVAVSFTVETDGRLPSGDALGEAIVAVDEATDGAPAWYMVNCAHPSHFAHVLDTDAAWTQRIQAVRANASRMSHAELDEAEDLDRGDPVELAEDYRALRRALPSLRVVGGCCGTDHEHVAAMAAALTT